jgi:hypothetical protein
MKKIGILAGMENSFPAAVLDCINNRNDSNIVAEFMKVDALHIDSKSEYSVILDRISNEVPFYRSMLRKASLNGTTVVNNPFRSFASDNFFSTNLAKITGLTVPKTVLLPSKEHPVGTSSDTFHNLIFPLSWQDAFDYVGFPAYIKPNTETPLISSYKVYNPMEFFAAYDFSGNNTMILQECIEYEEYYRCYAVGTKHVRIISYDPYKPLHLRFNSNEQKIEPKLEKQLIKATNALCSALGLEFNCIEFAIAADKAYATESFNVAPIIEANFFNNEDFNWLVETTSNYLIELANKENPESGYINSKLTTPKGKAGRPKKSVTP